MLETVSHSFLSKSIDPEIHDIQSEKILKVIEIKKIKVDEQRFECPIMKSNLCLIYFTSFRKIKFQK